MPTVTDNFTGTNGTAVNGRTPSGGGAATWEASAAMQIQTNRCTKTTSGTHRAVIACGSKDAVIRVTYSVVSNNPVLYGRWVDASNHWFAYIINNYVHICKREGGVLADPAFSGWLTNSYASAAGDVWELEVKDVSGQTNVIVRHQAGGVGAFTEVLNRTTTAGALFSSSDKFGVGGDGSGNATAFDDFSLTPVAVISIDRPTILVAASATVTLNLTGSNTTWDGSTTFTLSGSPPSGWSVASYNVASATSATVTLNRGTGTGTLTITDGTLSVVATATATATSVATGNWSSTATWNTQEAPSTTLHDAAVSAGHTVTVDTSVTIDDVSVAAAGTLLVAAGQALTADAITVGNAVIQVGEIAGGASLTFGSLAIGGNGQTNSRFRTRGTGGSVASSGGTLTVTDGTLDVQGTGTFVGLGGASADAVSLAMVSGGAGLHTISGWTFDGCGRVNTTNNLPASRGVSVTGCTFKSPTNAGGISLRLVGSAPSAGVTRVIDRNGLDGGLTATEGAFAITHNYLGQGFQGPLSSTWSAGQFDGNFCRLTGLSGTGISGMFVSGPVDGIYVLGDAGTDNPHLVRPHNTGAPTTFANGIIEYTSTVITDGGNWFYAANTADWTVDRCLTVFSPNIVGGSPGAVTFANLKCRVTNCTLVSGQYSGGILAGDGAAVAGTYPEVRDNIFWTNSGTACYGVSAVGSGTSVAEVVTPSGCHHNGFLNAAPTRYMGHYPTTQPGANDVTHTAGAAAIFIDPFRNIATWAVTRGSAAGTYLGRKDDALVYLRDDPALISNLIAYIRGGFVVTYAPFRTASSAGDVVGAVQDTTATVGQPAPVMVPLRRQRNRVLVRR